MSESDQFKKFFRKLLLFGLPVIGIVISYFVFDPFHVLYAYDAYPDNYLKNYNRNRIGTEVFLKNNGQYHYKSFIFGSSRSGAFLTKDWSPYINDPQPYHFDAFNEGISGIYGKIKFIKAQGNKIENAIILVDHETFNYPIDTANSIIHVQDYRWSGESWFHYQNKFFKSYFKDLFFLKYFDLKLFRKYKPYMKDAFLRLHHQYLPVSNDFIFRDHIERIKADSVKYYQDPEFFERNKKKVILPKAILDYQVAYLKELKAIFDKDHTNYKIIIAPVYDFKYYHPNDLRILRKVFGDSTIYDYSGKNKYTIPKTNYYEAVHFKPSVARDILKEVYQNDK